jgi:hypothetical protein
LKALRFDEDFEPNELISSKNDDENTKSLSHYQANNWLYQYLANFKTGDRPKSWPQHFWQSFMGIKRREVKFYSKT